MTRSKLSAISELLSAISNLSSQVFYSYTDVQQALTADVDPALTSRVIEAAVARGILGRSGQNYILRRKVEGGDLRAVATSEGITIPDAVDPVAPTDIMALAGMIVGLPMMEDRLAALRSEVQAMSQDRPIDHHWLVLHEERMPRSVREALRAKAVIALPPGAGPEDIHKKMVQISATILQHAVKAQ